MSPSGRAIHGRRAARSMALQVLFEVDSTGHDPSDVLARRVGEEGLSEEAAGYASELVDGVMHSLPAIDGLIQRAAPAWPFDQMARIDRNIIRIALYEALFRSEKLPFRIAVNEAVELAKQYGSDSSSRFVNGVVGKIVNEESARAQDSGS
ncbi:MAG TPA: transcription antitermination factor NusB [Chloroflexota bacterium]